MMVDDLLDILTDLTCDGMGEYPICVAFRWKGDTVISDIHSACLNGLSLQLNEEDFMHTVTDYAHFYDNAEKKDGIE